MYYKLIKCFDEKTNQRKFSGILKLNDNGSDVAIPLDPANTDYQEYLAWVDEGNTPEPADE